MSDPKPPVAAQRKDAEAEAGEALRHDTQELPVLRKDMKRAFRFNEVYTVIVAVVTAAVAVLVGYKVFVSEARAAGAEEAEKAKKTADAALKQGDELAVDMRELYKAFMYGKKSERLEQPPAPRDGGL